MQSTASLNSEALFNAFQQGAKEVIKHKSFLNRINVFPVADGDTGTNLASMMTVIIRQSEPKVHVSKTLRSVADASLIGSKGNSGIIFAQFFNGLSQAYDEQCKEHEGDEELSVKAFPEITRKAVKCSYNAIAEPVEGTIITVMRDWAHSLEKYAKQSKDFAETLALSLSDARESLKHTTQQLAALKENSVVDSGAQGFIYFVEGMLSYLRHGKPEDDVIEYEAEPSLLMADREDVSEVPKFRYCTEACLSGDGIDLDRIREQIFHLGDSAIVAGREDRCRIHVHTNDPAKLFAGIKDFGDIDEQKVDDMLRQYQVVHERQGKIAIVTDSTADLPDSFLDKNQVHVIPLNLMIEGTNYLDKMTINAESLYAKLDAVTEYPSTSQPNFQIIERTLSFLSSHYESIIVLSLSQALSGTFSVLSKAADSIESDCKISVVNTKRVSGALGLLVKKAVKLAREGHEHEHIVDSIEASITKTKLYVAVDNFKSMARSGRINSLQALIGKVSQIKPIIHVNDEGGAEVIAKTFSSKAANNKLIQLIKERHKQFPLESVVIMHADAYDRAIILQKKIMSEFRINAEFVMDVAPVLGLHAGRGCVGIATLER